MTDEASSYFGGDPARAQVSQRFRDDLSEQESREEAAKWAEAWVVHEVSPVHDVVVWKALSDLYSVDLEVGPGKYFHQQEDILDWLNELETQE